MTDPYKLIRPFVALLQEIVQTNGKEYQDERFKFSRCLTKISLKYLPLVAGKEDMIKAETSCCLNRACKSIFVAFDVQWDGSKSNPTLNIPLDLVKRIEMNKIWNEAAAAAAAAAEPITPAACGPYRGKNSYGDVTVRKAYQDRGLGEIEDALKRLSTGNLLDKQCLEKFFTKVGPIAAAAGVSWRTNDDVRNAEIISSQKQVLEGTLTNGTISKKQLYIRNVVTSASCISGKLSGREISAAL